LGELKIAGAAREGADALGERFDLRAFHDAVLENGGVPLPILETQIDEYIAAAQKKCVTPSVEWPGSSLNQGLR